MIHGYKVYRLGGVPNKLFYKKALCWALGLTLCSLILMGSRGGGPPARIYGWPKEFFLVRGWLSPGLTLLQREVTVQLFFSHFLVDLVFFWSVCLACMDPKKTEKGV